MRLKNYKDDLKKRLGDPGYAAEYLAQVLAQKDSAAFLIALKDVVEAGGGVGNLAGRVGLKRPSLYKILSRNGQSHFGNVAGNFGTARSARVRGIGQGRLNARRRHHCRL